MQPYQFFEDVPADTAPADTISAWFFTRKSQVRALVDGYTPQAAYEQYPMEALLKKLQNLDGALGAKTMAQGAAIRAFNEFINAGGDYGAWKAYEIDQKAKDTAERLRQQEAAHQRQISDAKSAARRAASHVAHQYPHGVQSNAAAPGQPVGRVVAGLAVVGQVATYGGISGTDMHVHAGHPLLNSVIGGANNAEPWPVGSCAEVDALKTFLHANAFANFAAIPTGALVFHAMVWHPGGVWQGKETSARWQDRGACKNCSQWFAKLGAIRA
ncbi:hypothetical protein OIE66_17145 [Nonomuraea sp. NBC_01738]|uniref:hypothetical protein n=1 Tax=Nonomuraea sp. NBC_01738 TaxID=2976003 RepID=UPI002E133A7D|nr:hypothetical protein OIE66_17145 [Nonomuraea sp. NBC_01738]